MTPPWSRNDLLSMARGNLVGVRGEFGEPVALPEWIASEHSPIDRPAATSTRTTSSRVADWMILTVNSSAVIVTVEGDTQRFLGYSHDELIGQIPASESQVAGVRMWQQLAEHPDRSYTSRRQWEPQGRNEGLGRDVPCTPNRPTT